MSTRWPRSPGAWAAALPLGLLLLPGYAAWAGQTLVEGELKPEHFQFATVVKHRGEGAGGWRAACLHVGIKRSTGELYICKMGVGMPIQTETEGLVSHSLAQRIAAECANAAAQVAFAPTTPATALGLACESFKSAYRLALGGALSGSSVRTECHEQTTPVEVLPP
jgi:hypothetical protein